MSDKSPEGVTVLPDGSAFAVVSMPLPQTHWLYEKNGPFQKGIIYLTPR